MKKNSNGEFKKDLGFWGRVASRQTQRVKGLEEELRESKLAIANLHKHMADFELLKAEHALLLLSHSNLQQTHATLEGKCRGIVVRALQLGEDF